MDARPGVSEWQQRSEQSRQRVMQRRRERRHELACNGGPFVTVRSPHVGGARKLRAWVEGLGLKWYGAGRRTTVQVRPWVGM